MSRLVIEFRCHNCEHANRQNLGMPNFKLVDYMWSSFSGAHCHLIEFPDHYVMAEVVEEDED